jgi:hypothetical protein
MFSLLAEIRMEEFSNPNTRARPGMKKKYILLLQTWVTIKDVDK